MKVSGSTASPIVSRHLGHLFGTSDAGRPQPVTRDTQGKGNWHIRGVDEVKNQRLWETCAERQTTKMGAYRGSECWDSLEDNASHVEIDKMNSPKATSPKLSSGTSKWNVGTTTQPLKKQKTKTRRHEKPRG